MARTKVIGQERKRRSRTEAAGRPRKQKILPGQTNTSAKAPSPPFGPSAPRPSCASGSPPRRTLGRVEGPADRLARIGIAMGWPPDEVEKGCRLLRQGRTAELREWAAEMADWAHRRWGPKDPSAW